jgi:hypothetical protein
MKLFLVILAVLASLSFAAPLKYVAVFETMADKDSVMDEAGLRYLTNELRKIAFQELPPPDYAVMTRDNIMAMLPPDKNAAECFEGQCLVEIGRNVGADYAVQGTVSKYGSLLTLSVECYETMGAKLTGSFTAESKTVEGLLSAMREQAPDMFVTMLLRNDMGEKRADKRLETGIDTNPSKPLLAWNHWVGIGLDMLGVAGLAFGLYQNSQASSHYDAYLKDTEQGQMDSDFKAYEDAKTLRNVGYIAGGVLLAGGLTFHFAF